MNAPGVTEWLSSWLYDLNVFSFIILDFPIFHYGGVEAIGT